MVSFHTSRYQLVATIPQVDQTWQMPYHGNDSFENLLQVPLLLQRFSVL